MSFTAVHAERVLLDATDRVLGFGWSWAAIHRVRPRVPLGCPDCGHGMPAKVPPPPRRLRYFARDLGDKRCNLAEQTIEHHLLKLEIAALLSVAGGHAELEAAGRGWRTDVLATAPDGRRVGWEVQLASITAQKMQQRNARVAADEVVGCWVALGTGERWLAVEPAVGMQPPGPQGGRWLIAAGLWRLVGQTPDPARGLPLACWNQVGGVTLEDFVAWVLAGKVVPRRFTEDPKVSIGGWTALASLDRARTVLADEQAARRRRAADTNMAGARRRRDEGTGSREWKSSAWRRSTAVSSGSCTSEAAGSPRCDWAWRAERA
ncbi:hypothetical protein GCM10010441_40060 [Kitasatospora paracochleata]|uniref:Competence protein CoiA n=1 Tax=Kitasatospora paracochleata TaxID=58354 RepID=A0ABT1IVW1_9ACTN|nr:hypothetical protein [Kitasatospora paracochleata]MCP2309275.1 competence protein CoiA [Kitasatospora paracochleata]